MKKIVELDSVRLLNHCCLSKETAKMKKRTIKAAWLDAGYQKVAAVFGQRAPEAALSAASRLR